MHITGTTYDSWQHPLSVTDEIEIRYFYQDNRIRCYLYHFSPLELPGVKQTLYGKDLSIEISIPEAAGYLQSFLDSQCKIVLLTDPSRALREFIIYLTKLEKHKCTM